MIYGLVAGIIIATWSRVWNQVRHVTIGNCYLKIWIPCAIVACISALLYWLDLWAFCAVIVLAELMDKDAFTCRKDEEPEPETVETA